MKRSILDPPDMSIPSSHKRSLDKKILEESSGGSSLPNPLASTSSSSSSSESEEKIGSTILNILSGRIYLILICSAFCTDAVFQKSRDPGYYGLGSAMIGSVTDVLSPILPFAGGVDLRRNENWGSWSSWLNLIYDGNDKARNSENTFNFYPSSFKRNTEKNDSNEQRIKQGSLLSTRITLSTPNPFVSTDDIAGMTLGDVALTFRFALEYGREGFDWDTFVSGDQGEALSPELIKILETTQEAFSRSRGTAILPASTSFLNETDREDTPLSPVGYGDIDGKNEYRDLYWYNL